MSFFVTKYPAGTFSYTDIASSDIEATKKFMSALLGWEAKDMPTEPGKPDYTQFWLGDKVAAGGMPQPPNMKGMPSVWMSYVTVDDIKTSVSKVEELGGKCIMPTMDVMGLGWMAGVQDDQGAVFFLWQAGKSIGSQVVNTPGAMSWNELYVTDVEKAKKFYSALFGWTYEVDEANAGYITIKNNGRNNGGIMAITPEMMGMPPNWTVYFSVTDADATAKKVVELGGKVMMTKDIGIGKIVMVMDPTGAAFIAMQLTTVKPEEWVE